MNVANQKCEVDLAIVRGIRRLGRPTWSIQSSIPSSMGKGPVRHCYARRSRKGQLLISTTTKTYLYFQK